MANYNYRMDTHNALEITPEYLDHFRYPFLPREHRKILQRPENWQDLIIKNWNDLISPDEPVLHLGDFALGKKSYFELLPGMLNGRLFLMPGNHDRRGRAILRSPWSGPGNDPIEFSLTIISSWYFSSPDRPLT